jgi:hypothetical protein
MLVGEKFTLIGLPSLLRHRSLLEADFIASLTSMSARVYGRRGNKKRAERI